MSINERKKAHIVLTSFLDLAYVLLLFKIGGKVDFLNNLSYLIILSGIVVLIGLIIYICLDIDVVEKYKNILGINKSQDLNF